MSKVYEWQNKLFKDAKRSMEEDTKDFVWEREEHGPLRVYKCGREGSSIFRFTVICGYGRLLCFGDMGSFTWERQEPMEPWFRGSVGSLDYLSEKTPQECKIREDRPELISLWLEDAKESLIEHGFDESHERYEALEDIGEYYEDAQQFIREVYESDYFTGDCDDLPDLSFYSYRYLWMVFAIEKCLNQFTETTDEV